MGAITRSIANNITTSGVFTSSAITNNSVTNITSIPNEPADGITLISSQTASASASISFTSGLTSTYKAYKFVFVNIHGANNDNNFSMQFSTNGGSTYATTTTSTAFRTNHEESDVSTTLAYDTGADIAQSTSFFNLIRGLGNLNDENFSGSMTLFNPSSTTYVKHFISQQQSNAHFDASQSYFIAGYANTTSAINAVQFKFDSGNIDAGTIYLYGIK
jgi:hypothetical protein